jgi:sugar lactone lactonase YvrE
VGSDGTIYVANGTGGYQNNGTISILPLSLDGKAKVRMIAGTSANDVTRLNDPSALVLDSNGNLYVVNSGGSGSVTVYGPRADGNIPPTRTISGEKTRLKSPVGIALDAAGKIYVTNDQAGGGYSYSITVYPAGSSGDSAPIGVIGGSNTELQLPQGIAVDSDGKIYVANDGNLEDRAEDAERYDDRPRADPADSITVYAPGSKGDVAPIAKINGSLTGLGHPMGIAVGP